MKSEPAIYTLYASPNTYSIGAHLLLEESGVPYRIINPRLNSSLTDTAFHRASPHGRVPAVILPGGTSIIESDNARQSALVETARNRLTQVWQVLEKQYNMKNHDAPWMFKSGPTALDFSLANVLLWPECFPASPNTYPALSAMLSNMSERISFKRIMPWHQRTTDHPPQRDTPGR